MKITYETSIPTLIQFLLSSLFILISQMGSAVVGCFSDGNDCVSNIITSLLFFIVASIFFGGIWLLGFAAQDRRSRGLARLLIAVESFVALLGLFSLKLNLHNHKIVGLLASIGILAIAAWIIRLAIRLSSSRGGRIVANQRQRQRRRPTSPAK